MNWLPLTRWERFKQWWCRYAPIPWKRCMICGRWFFNPFFWHRWTWKWGLPEYCSQKCCDDELDGLDAEAAG